MQPQRQVSAARTGQAPQDSSTTSRSWADAPSKRSAKIERIDAHMALPGRVANHIIKDAAMHVRALYPRIRDAALTLSHLTSLIDSRKSDQDPLRYVVNQTNKEIGLAIGRSVRTVQLHLAELVGYDLVRVLKRPEACGNYRLGIDLTPLVMQVQDINSKLRSDQLSHRLHARQGNLPFHGEQIANQINPALLSVSKTINGQPEDFGGRYQPVLVDVSEPTNLSENMSTANKTKTATYAQNTRYNRPQRTNPQWNTRAPLPNKNRLSASVEQNFTVSLIAKVDEQDSSKTDCLTKNSPPLCNSFHRGVKNSSQGCENAFTHISNSTDIIKQNHHPEPAEPSPELTTEIDDLTRISVSNSIEEKRAVGEDYNCFAPTTVTASLSSQVEAQNLNNASGPNHGILINTANLSKPTQAIQPAPQSNHDTGSWDEPELNYALQVLANHAESASRWNEAAQAVGASTEPDHGPTAKDWSHFERLPEMLNLLAAKVLSAGSNIPCASWRLSLKEHGLAKAAIMLAVSVADPGRKTTAARYFGSMATGDRSAPGRSDTMIAVGLGRIEKAVKNAAAQKARPAPLLEIADEEPLARDFRQQLLQRYGWRHYQILFEECRMVLQTGETGEMIIFIEAKPFNAQMLREAPPHYMAIGRSMNIADVRIVDIRPIRPQHQ